MKRFSVRILWVPFDHGVKLINGRPGARFGPKEIKKEFLKLVKKEKYLKKISGIGHDFVVPVKENVLKTHSRVTSAAKMALKSGAIPIVVGGGHDISFASGKGMHEIYKKIGQINIDAHYDVRPVVNGKITSGTPFRRLIEGGFLNGRNFVELGTHSPKNLPEHYAYLMKKNATVLKLHWVNKNGIEKSLKKAFSIAKKKTKVVVFDIDIDGIQKRFAPGCSAPVVKGFTKKQAIQAAYIAGKNPDVGLFNLMEINPLYDVRNKTVKLGAELIFSFIKGLNNREG
jgi:formimidoylglutamase